MTRRKTKPAVPARQSHPGVKYIPPSEEAIARYARTVCEKLAEHDPAFSAFEVRSGLAGYLRILANVAATQLNAPQDKAEEASQK